MSADKLKIAVVVHGRFFAFDLAHELLRQGHDVTLFTNYPVRIAEKFGIPAKNTRSFLLHGVLSRLIAFAYRHGAAPDGEPFLHRLFGRWAAFELAKGRWDIVAIFSGVAEEALLATKTSGSIRILIRGSAHIRHQREILLDECKRTGYSVSLPSRWIVDREEREYALADYILVLSDFCRISFVGRGVPPEKILTFGLGADTDKFKPSPAAVENRRRRLLAGNRLRVLTVGTFSFQKGAYDLVSIAASLKDTADFRFVGSVEKEAAALVKKNAGIISFFPKQDESRLLEQYEWGDVFLFPTIQDGFAAVLVQALVSALPILTTTNCGGPDLVKDEAAGWIVPIRDPEAAVSRLRWCDAHRKELADQVARLYERYSAWGSSESARRFADICLGLRRAHFGRRERLS